MALIQQMHFVVGTDAGVIRDGATRRAFVQACLTVLTILIFMKKRSVSHEALTTLDYNCQQVGPVFTQLFRAVPEEFLMNLDIPKVCQARPTHGGQATLTARTSLPPGPRMHSLQIFYAQVWCGSQF